MDYDLLNEFMGMYKTDVDELSRDFIENYDNDYAIVSGVIIGTINNKCYLGIKKRNDTIANSDKLVNVKYFPNKYKDCVQHISYELCKNLVK